MAVDAHAAGARPARRVIAHEPAVVVAARQRANGVFGLCDEGDGGEEPAAAAVGRADDALGRDAGGGMDDAEEREFVLARTASQLDAGAVLVSDIIRQLTVQRGDLVDDAVVGRCGRCIFFGIEP